MYNKVISEAIPKTRSWGLLLLACVLIGIVACDKIFQMFIPVFESVFTFTDEAGLKDNINTIQMGIFIFLKNTLVAFLCLLTARITWGIYPIIVLIFNGVLIGSTSAVLVKYGGFEVLCIAAGILPHAVFELTGILLACAIGFMTIPLKTKLQSSAIIWFLLLIAATIEVTISKVLLGALI